MKVMIRYFKIIKLSGVFGGQYDYKGLDLTKIIPNSQRYTQDGTEGIIATTQENVLNHIDLVELTEEEYTVYRQAIIAEQQAGLVTTEQRIADLEAAFAALYGMED